MAANPIKNASTIPDGYVPIPLSPQQAAAPLRLCVLVRREADQVAGHLVLLRDLLEARVYLGCVVDAGGQLQQWVEIWVQNVDALGAMAGTGREGLTNKALDQRWTAQAASYARLAPGTLIQTGWEKEHPRPLLLDVAAGAPVHPELEGQPWVLCQDDALLAARGLPTWSASPHRYLYVAAKGAESPLIAVSEQAPAGPGVKPATELLAGKPNLVPFNPGAGLLLARAYHSLTCELFIDLLGGSMSAAVEHGRSALPLVRQAPAATDGPGALADEGWLYLGKHGRSGRLLETLHLKLKLLAEIVETVREFTREHQRPLLNLGPDSFQVRLGAAGSGLPVLWTAGVILADPGDAVELAIPGTQARYFLTGRETAASIYRPAVSAAPLRGRCSLRIRQVLPEQRGLVLEGTLVTQERLTPGRGDLLWLRLNLGAGPADLHASVEEQAALARGEYRFRTIARQFAPDLEAQLRAAMGVPMGNTPFELLTLLSTPCDLYGIGVLAVRTLLAGPRCALPVALDELLSLAQQVAVEYDSAVPLTRRIAGIFERDPRWGTSLGPQHLVHEEVSAEEALDLVPAEVWWDVLGTVIRMFPALGPDSICADFGDAPDGAVHKVFDETGEALQSLLVRTRSLIVIDWRANREIHAVIRAFATGLKG